MRRLTERVERDLGQIADRATPSSTAWETIRRRIDAHGATTESTMEVILLSSDGNEPANRSRSWLLVAASVAALAVVGGLLVAANRDVDTGPADEPVATVPDTTGADGETAPSPDAAQQDPAPEAVEPPEPPAPEPPGTTEPPPAQDVAITAENVQGLWLNTVGFSSLIADFRSDGTFVITDTGRLGRGAFTNGTFETTDETTITFRTADDASECPGVTMTWTGDANDHGVMTVEAFAPDCQIPEPTEWEWTRVSPVSTASMMLQAGELDVAPVSATENSEIAGLWLRTGTGDVLVIDPAGTYVLISDGNALEPLDSGTSVIEAPGVLTFTSDGSGECDVGDVWTWRGVTTAKDLLRENQARGFSMRADSSGLCGSVDGGGSWRLLSPEKA